MKKKLSSTLELIFKRSIKVSNQLHCSVIHPEHVLYSMIDSDEGSLCSIFDSSEFNLFDIIDHCDEVYTDSIIGYSGLKKPLSYLSEEILESAQFESNILGQDEVTEEAYLLSMLKNISWIEDYLGKYGITYESVIKEFRIASVPQNSSFTDADPSEIPNENNTKTRQQDRDKSKLKFIEKYCFDFSKSAEEHKFDKVIGRDSEISQLIEILSCRKKNNAILLGDPGVGKTAIIEGLAQKIFEKDVPTVMLDKKIYSLDLNSLVSGTKFRGEFEERLQGIIKDVLSNPEVIIYIDEFHNIIGNGQSGGSGDAANILKPYLSRGEFQCIGSTTVEEYRKFVEKDGALKRRFQNIDIKEPNPSETLEILKLAKNYYEDFHNVRYSDEIVGLCVDLSGRFVTDRFFPDKALDILDMSGSQTKLKKTEAKDLEKIKKLNSTIQELQEKKKAAIIEQNFVDAQSYKDTEMKTQYQLKVLMDSLKPNPANKLEVTKETVYSVISKLSGVPISKIGLTELESLKQMKPIMEKVVIGQTNAVSEVIMSLQRNFLGLRDTAKPISSFLLVGPTGSGKTHLCKILAKEFFGSEDNLIKFDMAEFADRGNITKLIGGTASYIGYDDIPLFDKIRRKPYSVVVFDEIEKAAPEIFQIFLSILDEGIVTLGNGVKVNFRNCIIMFTGNIGTKELQFSGKGLGFSPSSGADMNEAIILKAIKKTFRPEFINRISKMITFNTLTEEDMKSIFELEVESLKERIGKLGYNLKIENSIRDLVIKSCDLQYGARDLQRNLVKYIENEICNKLLEISDPLKKTIEISKPAEEILVCLK